MSQRGPQLKHDNTEELHSLLIRGAGKQWQSQYRESK